MPRSTVRDWRLRSLSYNVARRTPTAQCEGGNGCIAVAEAPSQDYAYLLGLYLGDGCISITPTGLQRLRITCCDWYPHLLTLCDAAIRDVMPSARVGRAHRPGCTEVYASSRHWTCLFPQHGPGMKHERRIQLTDWQRAIVTEHPRALLRGLIHSDGSRVINRVRAGGRTYEYPRYFLSNESQDIQGIFCDACDLIGVRWRRNRPDSISIARRASVALLDAFVGPKS